MAGFNFIRQPFAFPSWIPSVQPGQIQADDNNAEENIGVDEMCSSADPFIRRFYGDKGNQELSKGNYGAALPLYSVALSGFDPNNVKDYFELSNLLRNMSECHLQLGNIDDAYKTAEDSLEYNPSCYRAQLILGDVFAAQNKHEEAFKNYSHSLSNLCRQCFHPFGMNKSIESIVANILKKCCIHYMHLDQSKYPSDIQQALGIHIMYNVWIDVLYGFMVEKNKNAVIFVDTVMSYAEKRGTTMKKFSLRPLCDMSFIQSCPQCVSFIFSLINYGCDYTQLSFEGGDTFIHAAVEMALATGDISVLRFICHEIKRKKHSIFLCDSSGNTALHLATKQKTRYYNCKVDVIKMLLGAGINPLLKNNDKKIAFELLLEDEKRSIQLLQKYNPPVTVLPCRKGRSDKEKQQIGMKGDVTKEKDESNMKILESTPREKQTNQLGAKKKEKVVDKTNLEREHNQTHLLEDKCHGCRDKFIKFQKAILEDSTTSLVELSRLIKLKHKGPIHKEITENSIKLITDFLAESEVIDIPPELCRISQKLFNRIIDDLKHQQKWLPVCKLAVIHSKVHGENQYSGFAAGIPLDIVLNHLTENNFSRKAIEIIDWFFLNGGTVADGGRNCIKIFTERKHYQLIETLVCINECDPRHLSIYSGDTPIHAALDIAVQIDQDDLSIFKKCMELYDKNSIRYRYLNPERRDENGDTLYHLIAKHKLSKSSQKLADILQKRQIRYKIQNKEGKYPHDYVKVDDPRSKIFQKAIEYETNTLRKSQKLCKTIDMPKTQNASVVTNLNTETIRTKSNTSDYKEINTPNDKEEIDKPVVAKLDIKIEEEPEIKESNLSQIIQMIKSLENKQKPKAEKDNKDGTEHNLSHESGHGDELVRKKVNSDDPQFDITRGMFEDPVWEMAYTYDFRKCMRDTHIMPAIKKRIQETIKSLVSGQWTNVLCKKLHTSSKQIDLYEAKLSKGSRLIWEVAIAFSPRLTNDNNPLYTQVIILWDVVMEHKNIHKSVERIVKCYEKGSKSLIKKKLQINKNDFDNTSVKHPSIYEPACEGSAPSQIINLYPPANSNDNEYTTIKFYTFSSNVAFSILHERKGEFPFRVTDLEYHIINLPFTAPVVVIGRSCTGKTTCCIYRLWYRFQQYWSNQNLDNKTSKDAEIVENSERHKGNICSSTTKEEPPFETVKIVHSTEDEDREVTSIQDPTMQFQEDITEEAGAMISCDNFTKGNPNGMSAVKDSIISGANEFMIDQVDSETLENVEHHLRQVFITKNGVLCSEVRKSFRAFMIGDGIAAEHCILEDTDLPNRLQDLSEKQYPLFITAKYFWLMLDATLGAPYYFERNPGDGSLKTVIKGWTDVDDISILLCMDEDDYDSDSTDESENNDTEHDSKSENISQKKTRKTDPRREVTYNVFEELLWPQMIGKTKLHKNRYHPLLIWTEIMSFIKGSFEALASKKDYLSKAEYFEMGRKQAPAFVGDRETLYELFLIYEHMRRQKCLFDQTDVVKNLYRRFMKQKRRKWIVHEIYVDEAQDFTQSELFLLINLCESPSGMFLTGDTAQSIMKGVSFRFKDLVSLFHYTSKNLTMNAVDVSTIPERVHSLPHNYRSHTGITDLAKSVLDILSDLFPDSFDKLQDEQCVFNGPKPVLLYAYSPDDLIKMLCHHKQETSQIEFGAHQAILVVDDDARDKVPEELKTGIVLTLYEAKGLEFDDILLFNIFKNSQASKEWRVVTDFLQRQGKDKTLQTGYSSRPLTFDPKLHKVLNSELKQLYTAITRARVNVWIFDEDVEKRTPMFQYFTALGLVKTSIEKNFTVKSTPAEWTASGEELMKRDLYEQAAQCFKMAGCTYKEELAYAYLHYKNARKKIQNSSEMREELYQATLKFLKLKRTKEAAKCLAMAKHYDLAAEIYEKRQRFEKAAEMFRRSNKPSECCRIFEHISRFDKAIGVLQEFNMFDEAIASLRRYKEKKLLNQIRMEDSIREHFYISKRKYGRSEAKCYHCSSVICGSLDSTSNLMTHMRRKHREVPLEILIQPDGSGLQNLYNRSDSSLHPLGSLYDEDQININAAGHYHKHHDINQMLKALDNISSLSHRIEFLTSRYNGRKEYITYAARILINKGETKKAVNLYKKYGFPEEALQFYETKRDSFSYIHCLVLSSLLQMKIKPDGSANAIKARIVEEHLNKSISMLLVCKEGNNEESVDVLTNTEGEANLLLGRLTGRQKYIELAFERFQVRQPLENKWGQMECLNWMMNISDLKRVSHLDLVVKWLQDTLAFLYTITSENSSREKIQLLEDYGVKQEGKKIFYNPRQNPPIRRLMKKVKNKSVKEEVENNEVRRVIVIDLLTNSCKWYWKLLPIVEKNYVNAISVDELNRYCSTFKNLENFLESQVQKIRLDYFLNGIRTFSNPLTKEEKPFLRKFKSYTSNFMSCRYLIRDMIQIVLQFNNLSMKECNCIRGQLIKVREEMENHFESPLAKARDKLYHKREKNISTFVEIITYHKLFGLSVNVRQSIFDLENSISEELLTYLQDKSCSNDQSITKVRKLGFMIPEFTAKPVVISIIRSFSDSVIEMREQKNPYRAVKNFSVFVERLQKQRTEYTLPELNLFLSWIRYYTFVGFVLQSKLATCQKRDDFQFFIPSSFLNTVRYIELTLFDDKLSTEKLIACCNVKKMPQINDIRNILETFVQLISGIRSKINITNIAFKRLMKSYQVRKMDPGKPDEELFYSDVAVVENVICWSLIFVINMDVAVFTQSETEILRQLSVHQNPDLYPERISNVLADIKSATGINNIKRSLHDFITHRGETLLRCKWDELKGCIIQEECDTQIDSMDTFHLHETLKTLTDQDQIIAESAGEEDIFETEEIKVTDVEIKTVFDDRKKLSTRTNDMELNAKTTKGSVYFESGIDEIQNDPLFAKLIIDKSRCDICGEIFEDKINKDNQGERTVNKVVHNSVSTKLSIKSIVNSLWSTSDNIVEPESTLSSKAESLSLQSSSRQSTTSVEETKKHLHSNVNKNIQTEVPSKGNEDFFTFPDPYDKTQQSQKPICTYEKHMLSTSHQDRLAEIRQFHQFYQKCVKPNLERVSQFISKYGLFTQENRQQFDEDMRIIRLVILYEECNADLHNIVRLKTWNEHYIAWKLNKLENLHNDVKKSVKELFDVINRKENSEDDDFDRLQYKPHKKTRRKTKWSKIDLK